MLAIVAMDSGTAADEADLSGYSRNAGKVDIDRPYSGGRQNLAAPQGFEPRYADPESEFSRFL